VVLENGVRRLYGVSAAAALTSPQSHALLSIWSVVHGFAHLALAGQFDSMTPPGGRDVLLRETLAAMLDQQLAALQPLTAKRQRRVRA
jgi:hypothetical protein